jgi:two-component sensor histidine kinase
MKTNEPRLTEQLEEASQRVHAVARAHERLYHSNDIDALDLGVYVELVCKDLSANLSECDIQVETENGLVLSTDRAISAALIISELVMNAAKYAYGDASGGRIWVRIARAGDDKAELSVRDEGAGLPDDFDPLSSKSLGMTIIAAFTQQLDGELDIKAQNPGTEFLVILPLGREGSGGQ